MSDSSSDEGWSRGSELTFDDAGQITRIDLYRSHAKVLRQFTVDDWTEMGDGICRSTALMGFSISECAFPPLSGFPPNAFKSLFGDEREYHHCSWFHDICVVDSPLNRSDMASMLPFLRTMSTMKTMAFMNCGVTDQMATMLAGALDHVCVEELCLDWNSIGDAGIESILSARNAVHLDTLELEDNPVRERGFDSIARFLQRSDTQLTVLSIDCDAKAAQRMVESVASNSNSKMIDLGGEAKFGEIGGAMSSDIITAISQVLQNVICNVSSFEALCQSNHRLTWIGPYTMCILSSSDVLRKASEINARRWGNSNKFVARLRSKLRAFYFAQREFDVEPFANLDANLMPHVLELVTRTEVHVGEMKEEISHGEFLVTCKGNLNGIYRLVRKCHLPELFSFPSPESKARASEKKIATLEEQIAQLRLEHEEQISQLRLENEQLRSQLTSSPNKRSKQARE